MDLSTKLYDARHWWELPEDVQTRLRQMRAANEHCELTAQIGPSLLSSDLSRMSDEAQRVMEAGGDYLHLDIMDGHFVDNITWGPPVLKCLRQKTIAFLDCHMMVTDPAKWILPLAEAGADGFTFHIEAMANAEEAIALVAKLRAAPRKMKIGVALNPDTDVDAILDVAPLIDMILVMTVTPGFGGQPFQDRCLPKITTLRRKFPNLDIQVDGGLNPTTVDAAANAGANTIVAGSAIFKSEDPAHTIAALRRAVVTAHQASSQAAHYP